MVKISICIPIHWMENWPVLLTRCLASIEMQSFADYEIILVKHSTMPITSNRTIESAKGELVKILYMDDYLTHRDSLKEIADNFKPEDHWLVTGCLHDNGIDVGNYHEATWTENISTGNNGIGSPSVVTLRKEGRLLFDTTLSFLLDCDLYKRMHTKYGLPKILNTPNVTIGIHAGQTTNTMSEEDKLKEFDYLSKKF